MDEEEGSLASEPESLLDGPSLDEPALDDEWVDDPTLDSDVGSMGEC